MLWRLHREAKRLPEELLVGECVSGFPVDLHELHGGLVPVGGEGHAVHVLHLRGVGEHKGSLLHGGQAVDLGAADAVVGGGCNTNRQGQ